ncbi:16S rRNA (cytidine(1402)-2'-O)-methyltransferase [bacterium]|nr:16S rRNA (cytidine(1402)-2'-O)-methyltransferase [bacterium]
MEMLKSHGILYIVSTPIGNMGDLSSRALECLRAVDIVACEDTRHTGLLFSRLGFRKKLVSYNDVNALKRLPQLIEHLMNGENVALVSDAGTPGISDPAYRIVRAALDAEVDVISIPGASAVLSALVVSGLPLDRFVFDGFIPPRESARASRLEYLKDESRTIVLFESPHRIIALLESVLVHLGNREISVSRELTKLHEETVRGPVEDVLARLKTKKPRGEYTVVIRGVGKKGIV